MAWWEAVAENPPGAPKSARDQPSARLWRSSLSGCVRGWPEGRAYEFLGESHSVSPMHPPVQSDRRIGMPTNSIGIRRRRGAEHPFSCPLRVDRLVRVHYKILAVRKGGGGWSPGLPAVGCAAACTARIAVPKDLGRQLCPLGDFLNVAVGLHFGRPVFGSAARNRLRVVVEATQAALPGGVIAAPVPTARARERSRRMGACRPWPNQGRPW
jgi:hypothetical protein